MGNRERYHSFLFLVYEFHTIANCYHVLAMPQSSTGGSIEAAGPAPGTRVMKMLRQTRRYVGG